MTKAQLSKLVIVSLLIIITGLTWFIFTDRQSDSLPNNSPDKDLTTDIPNNSANQKEQMDLVVYVQNVEAAITSDCGSTTAKTIQVPKTVAVADASLRYLFATELAQYGVYQSVTIEDRVAQITLASDLLPNGQRYSSLSSCQSSHLISVLADTLTQYDTISTIELYSPSGQVEF